MDTASYAPSCMGHATDDDETILFSVFGAALFSVMFQFVCLDGEIPWPEYRRIITTTYMRVL